jgi:hypothetical protein
MDLGASIRKLTLGVSGVSGPIQAALVCLLMATLIAGCQKKNDAISQAEKTDKINGVAVPAIEETKQIAQEGFIYGLL